ncbi:MAG: hypothetical protein D6798_10190 [Deltaproteobacteria bacterium]|nr:MAG: hypothetical protein D6798_10190 [Deltaproteobacteria bacterium]
MIPALLWGSLLLAGCDLVSRVLPSGREAAPARAADRTAGRYHPARPPDTGWWAPLPTYDCPPLGDDAVVLNASEGYVGADWYDGNSMAWHDELDLWIEIGNYTIDAEGEAPPDGVDHYGEFNTLSFVDLFAGGPADVLGSTLDERSSLALGGVWMDADVHFLTEDGQDVWYYGTNPQTFKTSDFVDVCISSITPDWIRGALYLAPLDPNEGPPVQLNFDVKNWNSPYWKKYDDGSGGLHHYELLVPQYLIWSGIWP